MFMYPRVMALDVHVPYFFFARFSRAILTKKIIVDARRSTKELLKALTVLTRLLAKWNS